MSQVNRTRVSSGGDTSAAASTPRSSRPVLKTLAVSSEDALLSGVAVGRAVGSLMRTGLEFALLGNTAKMPKGSSFADRALGRGPLGCAEAMIDKGASLVGASVGGVLRAGRAPEAVASALAEAVNQGSYVLLSLPVHATSAMTRIAGHALVVGATLVGAGVGGAYGMFLKAPVVGVMAGLGLDVSRNMPSAAGKVDNFDQAQLDAMKARAVSMVEHQMVNERKMPPCKPGWADEVKMTTQSRADMKANDFKSMTRAGWREHAKHRFFWEALEGMAMSAYTSVWGLGSWTPSEKTIRIQPGNLWGSSLEAAQRVVHHEMVHAWQSAHYPEVMPDAADTVQARSARTLWIEAHAVTNERAAFPKETYNRTVLNRLVGWLREIDPVLESRFSISSLTYSSAPKVFADMAADSRFDFSMVQRAVFETPALAEVLFGYADGSVKVALPQRMVTGEDRALVDYLWSHNIFAKPAKLKLELEVAPEVPAT